MDLSTVLELQSTEITSNEADLPASFDSSNTC